ncbi:beta transducin [Fusarium tjaetaba]|uniref:Beta transducin n=1 Tax=Fusarium tjaetaba TaxID=1567544 RepID=A0A8H5W5H4_9HYPO|nr:beta transducin [Fusarium tjaetaba]KAF5647656.1 beta transducin [Fusarium tjaetaba]
MRLLDANTLEVVEFMDHSVPKYVILSHTWVTGEEVTLQDMQDNKGMERSGYNKIKQACALALKNCYGYAWVDTCCIDKTSSAELSEAINSMMSWYERSEICYTYLSDVPPGTNIHDPESSFAKSRWFERGWTLQELIAPSRLIFLYDDWSVMSERDDIVDIITQITGIDQTFLSAPPTPTDGRLQSRLHAASIAEKMSWASERKTTRIEDTAYCLLEEIMKRSDDQTLLAWYLPEDGPNESGVLARSPAAFANCKDFIPCDVGIPTPPFQITNKGLRIEMPVSSEDFSDGRYALLQCRKKQDPTTMIAIPLNGGHNGLYVRSRRPLKILSYQYWSAWSFTPVNLLPSVSFASSIVQSPSYIVFLESIPENFYIAEVYPPNEPQQPDPRIIMTGTPEDEDQGARRAALVLVRSFLNDVEPFVVRIEVEPAPQKEKVGTESHLDATIRFVEGYGRPFFDGVSLASSLNGCPHQVLFSWTTRQQQGYNIGLSREHHFGKRLFVAEIREQGGDRHRPDWRLFDEDKFTLLEKGWTQALQRLHCHARSSARAVIRSLALSPWMFTFIVDSLIHRAIEPLDLMINHIEKHFKGYSIGVGVALFLRFYLRYAPWRRLQNFAAFRRVRTNSYDFVLFYLCCKLLPSELLEAILEKKWGELVSVLLGLGLQLGVTRKGANVTIMLI